MVPLNRKK